MSKRPIDLANRITLRPVEVREVMGWSRSHLARLLRENKLPKKVDGRMCLIKVADLYAYVDQLSSA